MIQLGLNFTHEDDLEIISYLSAQGRLHFVEILIDNFIYFDPLHIKDALKGMPCAIHVMNSHWLTEENFLESTLIKKLKNWISVLEPVYVSDHLIIGQHNGSLLPLNVEVNYDQDPQRIVQKITRYQDTLGARIYLENYPSYFKASSTNQIDFFTALLDASECGLLFDFSNAFIAEANIQLEWQNWLPLSRTYPATFHLGSYKKIRDSLLFDTHCSDLDASLVAKVRAELRTKSKSNIVIERDANKSVENCARDFLHFTDATGGNRE